MNDTSGSLKEIDDKAKILVLSHGTMCKSIIESASFIGLDVSNIVAIPMDEIVNAKIYENKIKDVLDSFPEGSLVFVDFLGGTPFNIIARMLSDYNVYGITGVNLPMIIEAWSLCDKLRGEELQASVIKAGKDGIVDINSFVNDL